MRRPWQSWPDKLRSAAAGSPLGGSMRLVKAGIVLCIVLALAPALLIVLWKDNGPERAVEIAPFFVKLEAEEGDGVKHNVEVWCEPPARWTVVAHVVPGIQDVGMSDGKSAWSFSLVHAIIGSGGVHKWDIESLATEVGAERAYSYVWALTSQGVLVPVNPSWKEWRRGFTAAGGTKGLLRRVSEDVAASVDMEVLGTEGEPSLLLWFGNEDGIIRKQARYVQGRVALSMTAKDVKTNEPMNESMFVLLRTGGFQIRDGTATAIKVLKGRD